jgi:sugar phosphate isomerase/epimerase
MNPLTRRDFVRLLAAAGVSVVAGRAAGQAAKPPAAVNLLDKLAVSTWSFRNFFAKTRDPSAQVKATEPKVAALVKQIKEKFDVRDVELCSAHLESFRPDYLTEVRTAVFELGCQFVHFTDHVRGLNIGRADRKQREHDLQIFEGLIGVAEQLAIRSMRVDVGSPENGADAGAVVDGIRRLARFGKERKVEIVLENRPGAAADPKSLGKLISECGDNVSACPDWMTLPAGEARFAALSGLLKQTRKVCAAPFRDLDEKGAQRDFDLARCFKALKAARFTGWTTLRYEGLNEPWPQLERALAAVKEWGK